MTNESRPVGTLSILKKNQQIQSRIHSDPKNMLSKETVRALAEVLMARAAFLQTQGPVTRTLFWQQDCIQEQRPHEIL